MPLSPKLSVSQHSSKKQKRNPNRNAPDDMAFFSRPTPSATQFLPPMSAHLPKRSQPSTRLRDDLDDFLSSDLELSFASTVSLHSPPRAYLDLAPESDFTEPMDISPASPKPVFTHPPVKDKVNLLKTRPRAFTSAARMFGRDMSNAVAPTPQLPPPPKTDSVNVKRIQRAALPMEWLNANVQEAQQNENRFPPVSDFNVD
jgi:M-phase inducer tyrosine phosphatase